MLNPRPLQLDAQFFGSDPLTFDPNRFMAIPIAIDKNPATKRARYERHPAFRPFGGGEAQCPGQQMAKQTAMVFVAVLFFRFDVRLVELACWEQGQENKNKKKKQRQGQKFPNMKPDFFSGVAALAPAGDLIVKLTERDDWVSEWVY